MTKIIKLVNNHEIIGDLIHESEDDVILDNPFSIHYMTSSRSDRPIIGLLRYMPFADRRDIVFKKRDIINYMNARKSTPGKQKIPWSPLAITKQRHVCFVYNVVNRFPKTWRPAHIVRHASDSHGS